MVVFPNCKINLGLQILGKRSDGFHDLQTVFYPIPLHDALEVLPSINNGTSCTTTGISIHVQPDDNICTKAYFLLKKDFPNLPAVQIHVHKAIPSGAGLGGGSSDGAHMLMALNKKWQLGLSQSQLIDYASQLGSDCPFFIINAPCLATGRGEFLSPIDLDLSAYKLVLIYPGIHINTGWAFSQLEVFSTPINKNMVTEAVTSWKGKLQNDFEEPVFRHYPEIGAIKNELYAKGAVYASLSGSGSTVFGIFSPEAEPKFSFPAHYFIKEV